MRAAQHRPEPWEGVGEERVGEWRIFLTMLTRNEIINEHHFTCGGDGGGGMCARVCIYLFSLPVFFLFFIFFADRNKSGSHTLKL